MLSSASLRSEYIDSRIGYLRLTAPSDTKQIRDQQIKLGPEVVPPIEKNIRPCSYG